jgi:FixJ family two-component response regulator
MSHTEPLYVAVVDDDVDLCRSLGRLLRAAGLKPITYASALQMLIEREQRATERGVVVWLVGLNPTVLDTVRHSELEERLGRERMLFNAREAIQRYQAMQTGAPDS